MITLAKGSDVTVLGKDGIIDIDCKYHEYTDQFANFILERGDLVIPMTGATVGKVSKIPSGRYLLNQRVGKVVITDQSVDLGFINLCIMTGEFHNYCQRTAEGGAQGNISGDQILKFLLPNLDIETQQKRLQFQETVSDVLDVSNKLIEIYIRKIQSQDKQGVG